VFVSGNDGHQRRGRGLIKDFAQITLRKFHMPSGPHRGDTRLRAQLSDDRDPDLKISKLYGMLPAETSGTSEGRTPADNQTVRNVFVIGPDKKIKLVLIYPKYGKKLARDDQ
jgi:hypothetical protein